MRMKANCRQVFLAIITNALDAMEDKGTITLETGLQGKTAFLRIVDTGPGIAAEHVTGFSIPSLRPSQNGAEPASGCPSHEKSFITTTDPLK